MHFFRVGKSLRVARITGPSHNLVGIEFGEPTASSGEVIIEALSHPSQSDRAISLSGSDVREQVLLGVADANRELGTAYTIKRIEFVPTESPPAETYRFLARTIVDRLAKGEPFDESA